MADLLLYSTNPWLTYEIGQKYRGGKFFVWCSEHFDPRKAPGASSAALIAPSSSPKGIFDSLASECDIGDMHSALIQRYRKKYKQLAKAWHADGSISTAQRDEILFHAQSHTWQIWRPVLFVIPKAGIESSRIIDVPARMRAAFGPEYQIVDLDISEFEVIER